MITGDVLAHITTQIRTQLQLMSLPRVDSTKTFDFLEHYASLAERAYDRFRLPILFPGVLRNCLCGMTSCNRIRA